LNKSYFLKVKLKSIFSSILIVLASFVFDFNKLVLKDFYIGVFERVYEEGVYKFD